MGIKDILRRKKKHGFEAFAEKVEQRRERKQELKRPRAERKALISRALSNISKKAVKQLKGKTSGFRRPKIIRKTIKVKGLSKAQFQRVLREQRQQVIPESILTARSGFFVNHKKTSKLKKVGFLGKGQI